MKTNIAKVLYHPVKLGKILKENILGARQVNFNYAAVASHSGTVKHPAAFFIGNLLQTAKSK